MVSVFSNAPTLAGRRLLSDQQPVIPVCTDNFAMSIGGMLYGVHSDGGMNAQRRSPVHRSHGVSGAVVVWTITCRNRIITGVYL